MSEEIDMKDIESLEQRDAETWQAAVIDGLCIVARELRLIRVELGQRNKLLAASNAEQRRANAVHEERVGELSRTMAES